ncbi:MAG: peroxide stress protein YaaA [Myxococcales bacterium]|nr:peroxide stress protein YaaA [Myxococcales bacterium]
MLALLSPAKKMDLVSPLPEVVITRPALVEPAAKLLKVARKRTKADWAKLMDLSDDLATSTFDRFRDLDLDHEGRPALLTFAGDVYQGADVGSWSVDDLTWAQDHLRILSGLYGLLRPLDGIAPYRLEMGTKLANPKGKDLYAFWRPTLAKQIDALADGVVVNLASDEYFSAVDKKTLKARVVTPVFQDIKDGKARSLFLFVKRARGAMARWIVQHRITDADRLKEATFDGYVWDEADSTADRPVFRRPQPPPPSRSR